MSKKKTIFDLYRENDANFSVPPSPEAWAKLERRLDGKSYGESRSRGQFVRMNFMSVAAGLMLVVGAAIFVMLQVGGVSSTDRAMAMNDSPASFFVEDLVLTDTEHDFQAEWLIANDYRARFAGGYVPAEKDLSKMPADNGSKIQPRRLNQKPPDLIAVNEKPVEIAKEEAISDHLESELLEQPDDYVFDEAVAADYEKIETAPYVPQKRAGKVKPNSLRNTINDFQWLVGNWEQQMSGMKSVERWVADSANTISGAGYLVQGDDTVFTESPTITQVGDKIYFFQNIESPDSKVPYVLAVQNDTQWVFENMYPNVPERVILTRGKRHYDLEILEVPSKNAAFLKKRNLMISNSARRSMARTN